MATTPPANTTTSGGSSRRPIFTSNFRTRALTAAVFLPIGIAGAISGGIVWTLMVMPMIGVGMLEFIALARGRAYQGHAWVGVPVAVLVLVGFHREEPVLWIGAPIIGVFVALLFGVMQHGNLRRALLQTFTTTSGGVYVGFPLSFLAAVRGLSDGLLWLSVVLATTWSTDTFAYFGGLLWGKRKLAPRISPKKTVEGAVIGIGGGFVVAVLVLAIGAQVSVATLVMAAVAPLVAVAGDLLESAIKRFFDVKDSHLPRLNIVPGHGGVLDRVDSLMMVATFCYLYLVVVGITG